MLMEIKRIVHNFMLYMYMYCYGNNKSYFICPTNMLTVIILQDCVYLRNGYGFMGNDLQQNKHIGKIQ